LGGEVVTPVAGQHARKPDYNDGATPSVRPFGTHHRTLRPWAWNRTGEGGAALLTLQPGDVATADVQAYAIDTATGNTCPRWGNLVVTPPNDYVSHPLSVDVPICSATISSVD
jgi:hypothetical protein